jgi:hypothetical protein
MTDSEFQNENITIISIGQTSESKAQLEINSQTNTNNNLFNNEISLISLNNNTIKDSLQNKEYSPSERNSNSPIDKNLLLNNPFNDNPKLKEYHSESRLSSFYKQKNKNLNNSNSIINKFENNDNINDNINGNINGNINDNNNGNNNDNFNNNFNDNINDNININNIKKNLDNDFINEDININFGKKDRNMPAAQIPNLNTNIQNYTQENLNNLHKEPTYNEIQNNQQVIDQINYDNYKIKKKKNKNKKKRNILKSMKEVEREKKCCGCSESFCAHFCGNRGFCGVCIFIILGFIITILIMKYVVH